MAKNDAYLSAGRSKASDECITPRYGVRPLVKHLKAKGYKKIWCPFDEEDSAYVRVLRSEGFEVVATCLRTGHDFFKMHPMNINADCIVSNPPFSCKDKILERLYSFDMPFAILLPQNSLQAISRVEMFLKYGVEYLGFDRRICFYTRGELDAWKPSNHFASGYFCRDVLPEKMVFERLKPIQEPYHNNEGNHS